jgi:hypothetical protein
MSLERTTLRAISRTSVAPGSLSKAAKIGVYLMALWAIRATLKTILAIAAFGLIAWIATLGYQTLKEKPHEKTPSHTQR